MQCISLKLVQESRTLLMESAEFIRTVDDECETGASNALLFRVKVRIVLGLALHFARLSFHLLSQYASNDAHVFVFFIDDGSPPAVSLPAPACHSTGRHLRDQALPSHELSGVCQ